MSTTPAAVPVTPANSTVSAINEVSTGLIQDLPLINQVVVGVENATKGAVPGSTKLTMALNIVQALSQTAAKVSIPGVPEVQAAAMLASLITAVVQAFNASGVFTHSTTPVTTTPSPVAGAVSTIVPTTSENPLMKLFAHFHHAAKAVVSVSPTASVPATAITVPPTTV